MKTLLIPVLAFTLAGLPAHAQKTAEPAAPTPPPAVALPAAPAAWPGLLRKVQFEDAALSEVISYLNAKLAEQKGEPLNVVVSAGLETTKVPTVLLQNVTATDVLNVVAKMTDLTVEPVPSDSGKVAAWIITKRVARPTPGATSEITFYNSSQLDAPGGASADADTLTRQPREWRHSYDTPSLPNPVPVNPAAGMLSGGVPVTTALWDPLVSPPAPAQVSRVIGIGKIYEDSATPEERAKKEAELSDMLSVISRDQKMECKVKFYENLHVIVLKGTPEGVALIEQTVAAMKENAGVKNPAPYGVPTPKR